MLIPAFVLWDVGYPFYTYGSIFIIALLIWQVKKRRQKLRSGPNKTCCQHHRRVKHKSRDRASRAKKTSQEEAEKLRKLLSVMKSQGWLPQVDNVRRILCADPCCQICNSMALEIQQLLEGDTNRISPALLGTLQGSSCVDTLSTSSVSYDQSSQNSRQLSQASGPMLSRTQDRKPLTQPAALSTGPPSVHSVRPDHHQQRQKFQVPKKSKDAGALSSSSLEEPGIPVNQKEKSKTNSALVLKKQAPENDLGKTMTLFSHWINPEVIGQKHEEHHAPSKAEKVTKSRTKEAKKGPNPTKDRVGEAKLEKKTEKPVARPAPTEKERLSFLDALCAFATNSGSTPKACATPATPPNSVVN